MICGDVVEFGLCAELFSLLHKRLCVLVVDDHSADAHKCRAECCIVECAAYLEILFDISEVQGDGIADLYIGLAEELVCNKYLALFHASYLLLVLVKVIELCFAYGHKVY